LAIAIMQAGVTLQRCTAYKEETMVQHADKHGRRATAADAARRETRQDARYKPVALPAVAAAMQAVKTPPRPSPAHRPPAILNRETD
jgi:hypothetical protein